MANTAIIIGAGPGGLTAAYELKEKISSLGVVILERGDFLGGLSRTINHDGNRMDIGGHRFFSKSDRVMSFWQQLMPVEHDTTLDHEHDRLIVPRPELDANRMLERRRISRIFYQQKFFDYPVQLSKNTIANLGPVNIAKIGASYAKSMLLPRRKERTLEDFLVNRFGYELYATFFRDYTEKVWGVPCSEIKPEWGAQRIKGLSILSAVKHALRTANLRTRNSDNQKDVETSLIERFLYPKYGPGQMWEELARRIESKGCQIVLNSRVCGLSIQDSRVVQVTAMDEHTHEVRTFDATHVFSTMPVDELIAAMQPAAPEPVQQVAAGLRYRDFISVGLLVPSLKIRNTTTVPTRNHLVPDNWIYVQENSVKLGRLQIFQNWSPYMVKDLDKIWLGLEYFCNKGDALWNLSDRELLAFAGEELRKIGIIDSREILDGKVVHVEKTYPAYFGTYDSFPVVREFTDSIENLFLIGRNGMHRYNNADHSMLTAMTAVDNLAVGRRDKSNIWSVNTESEYHEERMTRKVGAFNGK
jgi:protoporphyrinogen oxidase